MSEQHPLSDKPFSFRQTKGGLVRIAFQGKVVTTLSGKDAAKFMSRADASNPEALQLLMAKATGHFKHGTERVSKEKNKGR